MPRPINQFLTVDRFHGFPALRFIKNPPLNHCKSKLDIKKTPSPVKQVNEKPQSDWNSEFNKLKSRVYLIQNMQIRCSKDHCHM